MFHFDGEVAMMSEPVSTGALGVLGLKVATLVAGFAGSVVSLSYITALSPAGRVTAVIAGTLTAGYSEPMITQWGALGAPAANSVAFLIGLTSMNLVPGVIRISEWLRDNGRALVARRLGGKADDDEQR